MNTDEYLPEFIYRSWILEYTGTSVKPMTSSAHVTDRLEKEVLTPGDV